MSRFSAAAVIVLGLLASASSAMAHHSFAAEYDKNKQCVKGVVLKVALMNPNAYVYIDVTAESGKVTTWAFESPSPNALARQGWTRNSLKVRRTRDREWLPRQGRQAAGRWIRPCELENHHYGRRPESLRRIIGRRCGYEIASLFSFRSRFGAGFLSPSAHSLKEVLRGTRSVR